MTSAIVLLGNRSHYAIAEAAKGYKMVRKISRGHTHAPRSKLASFVWPEVDV